MAALKAIGGFLKKASARVAKEAAKKKATEVATKNAGVIIAITMGVIFFFMVVSLLPILAPISFSLTLKNYLTSAKYANLTEEQRNAIIYDAGELSDYIRAMGTDGYTSQMFGIDEKTILRILDAVDVYNDSMENEIVIEYKYRVERVPVGTEFPKMDPDTGVILENTDNIEGYEVYYEKDKTVVSRKNVESQQLIYGTSQNLFKVQWQPIMALCCMKIIANAEFWGTYTVEDGQLESGEPNYYLSDSAIQDVIDVFLYRYQFIRDIREDEEIGACSFESFLTYSSYGFDLAYSDYKENDGYRYRETRRIPKLAPKRIYNSYVTYEYYYDNVENEDAGLVGDVLNFRSIVIEPQKLIGDMKKEVSIFDEEWFLSCLEQLPLTDELCVYYENLFNTPDNYKCSKIKEPVGKSKRVFVFGNAYGGAMVERPEEGIMIPLYYAEWSVPIEDDEGNVIGYHTIHLEPGDWLDDGGPGYKYYSIRPEAITSNCGVDIYIRGMNPDGTFSGNDTAVGTIQIGNLVDYCFENYPNYPLFQLTGDAAVDAAYREDLIDMLYGWQNERQCSIAGIFGIMKQETGMLASSYARYWNFFNITTNVEHRPKIDGTVFIDYKTWKGNDYINSGKRFPIIGALEAQMDWIYLNYWSDGQDTYYSMIFNGYDISNPEKAYQSISHSYCPPWQDTAMPFSANSHDGNSYFWKNSGEHCKGWVNKCAEYKMEFEQALRFYSKEIYEPLLPVGTPLPSSGLPMQNVSNLSWLEMKVIE